MASKPANGISWASDANYASGSQVGQTTRLAPSAGYKAQGFIPRRSLPARYLNWVLGTVSDWVDYLKDGLLSGAVSVVDNDLRAFGDFEYCDATGAQTLPTRTLLIPLTSGMPNVSTPVWAPIIDDASDLWYLQVSPGGTVRHMTWQVPIPEGAEVTLVRAGVTQIDTAAATPMKLEAFRASVDKTEAISATAVASLGSDTWASGGASSTDDVLSITLSPTFVASAVLGRCLIVRLSSSNSASDPDAVWWLEVTFTDPGPRNY